MNETLLAGLTGLGAGILITMWAWWCFINIVNADYDLTWVKKVAK
jgi:hypothetical protein